MLAAQNGRVNSPVQPLDEKNFRLRLTVLSRSAHISKQQPVLWSHALALNRQVVTAPRVCFPGSDYRVDSQRAPLAISPTFAFPPLLRSLLCPVARPPLPIRSVCRGRRGCFVIYALPGQLKRFAVLVVLFPVAAIATRAAITPSSQRNV